MDESFPISSAAGIDQAGPEFDRSAGAALPTRKILLGEELPIFCEKCGYALHGLGQQVCERCSIRHFHCPECGHHQPINTLRPAAQKLLGRMRAFFLAILVFFKINFFGWLLVAFAVLGNERAYQYHYDNFTSTMSLNLRHLDTEDFIGFSLCGFFFGVVGRMFLLRWRRGYLVGLVLGVLVFLSLLTGALLRGVERRFDGPLPSPFSGDFLFCMMIAAGAVLLGASVVWVIWSGLVHVLLPQRTSSALLDWQREQSVRGVAELAK